MKTLSVFVGVALAACLPTAATGAQTDKVAICHGEAKSAVGRVMQLPLPAMRGHLSHGDCRVEGNPVVGSPCDRSNVDATGLCARPSTDCGDGAGPGAADVPCRCGDTVVTDTRLDLGFDPVASTTCSDNGLVLAANVQLDLGGLAIQGGGSGNGISLHQGGALRNGTVAGFRTGIAVAITTAGSIVEVDGVTAENNTGAGAMVEAADAQSRVVFSGVTLQGNGGDGVHVRAAPGTSNLDDPTVNLSSADYGFVLRTSQASANAGYGVHLGDVSQPADVAALIGGVEEAANQISRNGAGGVLLEQAAGLAPGADCGASAAQPGCAGATLAFNIINDNAGSGVELRAGFMIALFESGAIEQGLGFVGNEVFHNAMGGPGCTATQTLPQVQVTGPVGLGNTACSAAGTQAACAAANFGVNRHCLWTGFSCNVAWDLKGDTTSACTNGLRNSIFDYNTSDTGNANSVGMRALNGAIVDARQNEWRSSDITQNASQSPGSFVQPEPICGTRGTCTSP